MLLVAVAIVFVLTGAAQAAPRIVDGDVAEKGEVPWQLSMQLDGSHICGAVVLSPEFVLTAAHCLDFKEYETHRFTFVCGLHDLQNDVGQTGVAQTIVMHSQYDADALGFPNDIGIVKIDPPFQFDELCQPAVLPSSNDKDYVNKNSTISGWGRLYGDGPLPTLLKKAHIPIITNSVCKVDYDWLIFQVIRPSHICVKDPKGIQGACNGDSGGPLTTPDFDTGLATLTGITSFGKTGCDTNSASVYTRVSYYLDWIKERMQELQA